MWLIKLQQKVAPETPRYYAPDVPGRLSVTLKRVAQYSTEASAAEAAVKLEPHPWGRWVVEEK